MDAFLNGLTPINLSKLKHIGQGGEADVYRDGNLAIKIFKQPTHPDFDGDTQAQLAAQEKLKEMQQKLPAFPNGLPMRVIGPKDLVKDKKGIIVGYTMNFVDGAEMLMRYGREKDFRDHGIYNSLINEIFLDLSSTVSGLHGKQVVIGDFNDLNVMVKGSQAYLIDADSCGFGKFPCRLYTERFVDPLQLDKTKQIFSLVSLGSKSTDWYSFNALLLQSYLLIGPYGGVHKPKNLSNKANPLQRLLRRITIFSPDILYPKAARPLKILSDELLGYFEKVFVKDLREVFPRQLIERTNWTICSNCGTEHARGVCPNCMQGVVKKSVEIRGQATATTIFDAKNGAIVFATVSQNKLLWLYHEGRSFKRGSYQKQSDGHNEVIDAIPVIQGDLDPQTRYRLIEDKTLIGKGNRLVTIRPSGDPEITFVDTLESLPMFATNQRNLFWCGNGKLMRLDDKGFQIPVNMGSILEGRTLIWAGEDFGFGFYRAQGIDTAFVFDVNGIGINDNVKISFRGAKLLDSTAIFCKDKCWFFAALSRQGKLENYCWLIDSKGNVLAQANALADDGSWLGTIRNKVAFKNNKGEDALLCATDQGLIRVEDSNGQINVIASFPDTEPFVDANTNLFFVKGELVAVSSQGIKIIRIS